MRVLWSCSDLRRCASFWLSTCWCQYGLASKGLWPMVPMFILTLSPCQWTSMVSAALFSEYLFLSLHVLSFLLPPCLSSRIPTSSGCPGSLQVEGGFGNQTLQPVAPDSSAVLFVAENSAFITVVPLTWHSSVPSMCVTCGSDSET